MKGCRLAGRLRRQESGWTLIEMMMATALLAVILTAVLSLLDVTSKIAPKDQERAHDIREAQVGVYRMTRELRQAYSLVQTQPYLIEAHVHELGGDHDVVYDCSGASVTVPTLGECIRYEMSGGAPGTSTVIIDRLINKPGGGLPAVFTYTQNSGKTTYVGAHIEVPSKGARKQGYTYRIVLSDGFYLRNLNLG
jgi:prepilin-type N-terminal cleavage/methylation domain-containing protein